MSTATRSPSPAPIAKRAHGVVPSDGIKIAPGLFILPGYYLHPLRAGVPKGGTLQIVSETDIVRNKFFGLTGTYYDKDLTDIVYRYDVLYQPDHAISSSRRAGSFARSRVDRAYALHPRGRPSDLHPVDIEAAHVPDGSVHGDLAAGSSGQCAEHRGSRIARRRQGARAQQPGVHRGNELADERTVDGNQRVPMGHRQQRRRAVDHQRLPVFAQRAVRAELRSGSSDAADATPIRTC